MSFSDNKGWHEIHFPSQIVVFERTASIVTPRELPAHFHQLASYTRQRKILRFTMGCIARCGIKPSRTTFIADCIFRTELFHMKSRSDVELATECAPEAGGSDDVIKVLCACEDVHFCNDRAPDTESIEWVINFCSIHRFATYSINLIDQDELETGAAQKQRK